MISWIRRKLGLCVHEWNVWCPVWDFTGAVCAHRRECKLCPCIQTKFLPDGH